MDLGTLSLSMRSATTISRSVVELDGHHVGYWITIWLVLWSLRSSGDDTRKADLCLFVVCWVWRLWREFGAQKLLTSYITNPVVLLASAIAACSGRIVYNYFVDTSDPAQGEAPWLLPSRTSHTRTFPKKHSFAYNLLQVAVPVGSNGCFGSLISVGNVKRKAWYHVQASDYLTRNSTETNLKSKLRAYLHGQSVEDRSWNHAYLITAPRFLGYAFNPVSFWYIYTADDVLTMMILEVNNTFGERRMYLLHAQNLDEKFEYGSAPALITENNSHIKVTYDEPPDGKFRQSWTKDFHVSPFNSRKGFYTITAADPFKPNQHAPPCFSNTITLKSSKDHVKLVARVFSDGKPVNAVTASWWEMSRFVLTWWWVGFLTFPRILKEAAKLFWKRRLHVFLRPEVLVTSVGRKEIKLETDLASFFESYLEHLVAQCASPIRVAYTSNLRGSSPRIITNGKPEDNSNPDTLNIKILSPAFFARFVHYFHSSEAFDGECILTDEKNRTVLLSRPDFVNVLLQSHCGLTKSDVSPNFVEKLRWNLHRLLRCPPALPTYPSSTHLTGGHDIRSTRTSELDIFVMAKMPKFAAKYRQLCGRVFLAQRFTLGFVEIVDLLDLLIRAILTWWATKAMAKEEGMMLGRLLFIASVHTWVFVKEK